jgi:hypothetical protein
MSVITPNTNDAQVGDGVVLTHTGVVCVKQVCLVMILPQVHLRKPCYDFTFL